MQSDSEMNANQLPHNHQLIQLKARHVPSRGEREVASDLIRHYARQVTAWRRPEGHPRPDDHTFSVPACWQTSDGPVSHNTQDPPGTGAWENEGGALASPDKPMLPDGVIAIPMTHYRVGQYTYTNLDDAMAQYRRQSSK